MARVSLRIVQLSDLHLRPRVDDRRWETFERLLAELSAQLGGFDRIVLTGDLAAHGERSVYESLRARVAAYLPQLRVVSGNHDTRHHLRGVFEDRFVLGPSTLNFVEDLKGVRLIGLDSTQPFRVGGTLGKTQLDWLAGMLPVATPSLIFLHHPPLAVGSWWLDKDRLRDRMALARVLQDQNVLGIFCGHVHQEFEGRLGAIPVWTTPSTAYQFKPRSLIPRTEAKEPGFRVIEVHDGLLHTQVIRSANPSS